MALGTPFDNADTGLAAERRADRLEMLKERGGNTPMRRLDTEVSIRAMVSQAARTCACVTRRP
jgi:hypothetical protein